MAGRVAAVVVGALLLPTGLALAGLAVARAASSQENALVAAGALSLAGEVTVLAGFLLLWLGQRTVAFLAIVIVGLASVPTGIGLLAVSPLLRQLDNPDLDPERAANAAIIAGTAFLVLGLALLVLAWSWSRTSPSGTAAAPAPGVWTPAPPEPSPSPMSLTPPSASRITPLRSRGRSRSRSVPPSAGTSSAATSARTSARGTARPP